MESEDIIRAGGAVFKVWGLVTPLWKKEGGGGVIGRSLSVAV